MKVITVTFHLKEQLLDVLKENLYEKQNCWKEMMIGTNIGLIIEFNETPPLSAKTQNPGLWFETYSQRRLSNMAFVTLS